LPLRGARASYKNHKQKKGMKKIKSNKNINESTSKRNILKNMRKRSIMALEQLDCQEKGARRASWFWNN
jgi:hypothetical protein